MVFYDVEQILCLWALSLSEAGISVKIESIKPDRKIICSHLSTNPMKRSNPTLC